MRFPPQFLDELRARLPVSEVVGRRVQLKKAGREWKGLSPFNKERTPSFFVNDQKGFYHDFSSGKHGDIFSFVMETEGVDLSGSGRAAGRACRACGPRSSPRRRRRRRTAAARSTRSCELAAKFFEATLASRAGRAGAGLSRRPRARSGDPVEVPPRLRASANASPSRSISAATACRSRT